MRLKLLLSLFLYFLSFLGCAKREVPLTHPQTENDLEVWQNVEKKAISDYVNVFGSPSSTDELSNGLRALTFPLKKIIPSSGSGEIVALMVYISNNVPISSTPITVQRTSASSEDVATFQAEIIARPLGAEEKVLSQFSLSSATLIQPAGKGVQVGNMVDFPIYEIVFTPEDQPKISEQPSSNIGGRLRIKIDDHTVGEVPITAIISNKTIINSIPPRQVQ